MLLGVRGMILPQKWIHSRSVHVIVRVIELLSNQRSFQNQGCHRMFLCYSEGDMNRGNVCNNEIGNPCTTEVYYNIK